MDVGERSFDDDVARLIEHSRGVTAAFQVQSYGPCFRAHEAGIILPPAHSCWLGLFDSLLAINELLEIAQDRLPTLLLLFG